ncbi:MAG: chorismate-binding protein [Flavobacteriaceae bacterium]|nr:chorismate-binding protein [Flavobacteriaceae bacterium]
MQELTTDRFFEKLTDALNTGVPCVAYRLPGTTMLKAWFQAHDECITTMDYSEPGFVFAPFDASERSVLFPSAYSEIVVCNYPSLKEEPVSKELLIEPKGQERLDHIALVGKGIDFLKETGYKKVVLSRQQRIEIEQPNVIATFKKLLNRYPAAMGYCWYHPKVGLWLGATPETLLKIRDNTFTTMALAGTQVYNGTLEVTWDEKEKQEQQYVTDFITDRLMNVQRISGPVTVRAGNLVHLCTIIEGALSSQFTLQRLIALLHPTPAVCGLPQAEARQFILENEHYQRTFYTGFLGELNLDNDTNLFVNLRCMELVNRKPVLYIGGGITIDSDPVNEWEETVSKSKVMLKVIL